MGLAREGPPAKMQKHEGSGRNGRQQQNDGRAATWGGEGQVQTAGNGRPRPKKYGSTFEYCVYACARTRVRACVIVGDTSVKAGGRRRQQRQRW